MRKEEQRFVTRLQKWLKYNHKVSGPIECKVSYKKKFNYRSGFKPHQLPALMACANSNHCVTYKLSDVSAMAGFGYLPWDLVTYYNAAPFVAIQWIGSNVFYLVSPFAIIGEINNGSKSLTEDRAKELATVIGELK